jgi:hypothetical protein
MNKRQLGKIHISDLVELDDMALIFSKLNCVPIKVDYFWCDNKYEYILISDKFKEIKEGEEVPFYQIGFNKETNNLTINGEELYTNDFATNLKDIKLIEAIMRGLI